MRAGCWGEVPPPRSAAEQGEQGYATAFWRMVLCSEANKSFFQNVLLNFSKKIAAGGNPLHGASYCLTLLPLKTASEALPFFKSFDQTFLKVCRRRHCDAVQGR